MFFGIDAQIFGAYGDARTLSELAHETEESGWDGFFIWDHMSLGIKENIVDPWVALAAIAMRTERVRIGTMVTPMARRRPWKLARETVSVDRLSNGRLILGVGLGSPKDLEFENFGEEGNPKVRGRMLDEGLEILSGLWKGEPFSHHGEHYRVEETTFLPRPAQSPRIPIWVAGNPPNKPPFRRAARWDGVFPVKPGTQQITPDELATVVAYIKEHRTSAAPFDVVLEFARGSSNRAEVRGNLPAYAEAGLTWWLEDVGSWRGPLDEMRDHIRQGPPRIN